VDIEDISNSKVINIGEWNSIISPGLMIEKKKE